MVLVSDDCEGIRSDQLEAKDLIKLKLSKDVKSDSTQVEEKLKPNDSDNMKGKFTLTHNHETPKSQHKDLKDVLSMLNAIYQDEEDMCVNTSNNVRVQTGKEANLTCSSRKATIPSCAAHTAEKYGDKIADHTDSDSGSDTNTNTDSDSSLEVIRIITKL